MCNISEMDPALCYSEISAFQNQTGQKMINMISLQKKDHILDLGCGTGQFAKVLSEKVGVEGHIVAIDPDKERIKVAKDTIQSDNVHFIVASDKDFPQDCYDKVVATAVVHWIEDKKTAFTRIYDNLKPGGQFGFTTMNNPSYPEVLYDILAPFGPQILQGTLGMIHFKSASYYSHLAKSIGYEITHLEVENFTFSLPDITTCIDFYYGIFQGCFDRSSPLLDSIRKKYEHVPIKFVHPVVYAILTKPFNN